MKYITIKNRIICALLAALMLLSLLPAMTFADGEPVAEAQELCEEQMQEKQASEDQTPEEPASAEPAGEEPEQTEPAEEDAAAAEEEIPDEAEVPEENAAADEDLVADEDAVPEDAASAEDVTPEEPEPTEEDEVPAEEEPPEETEPSDGEEAPSDEEPEEPEEKEQEEEPLAQLPVLAEQVLASEEHPNVSVSGLLPEGAFLAVAEVEPEQVSGFVGENEVLVFAYDITINYTDADGVMQEYQPGSENPVRVSIASAAEAETPVEVMHIAEDEATGETVAEVVASTEATEEGGVEFSAESFSVYVGTITVDAASAKITLPSIDGINFYSDSTCENEIGGEYALDTTAGGSIYIKPSVNIDYIAVRNEDGTDSTMAAVSGPNADGVYTVTFFAGLTENQVICAAANVYTETYDTGVTFSRDSMLEFDIDVVFKDQKRLILLGNYDDSNTSFLNFEYYYHEDKNTLRIYENGAHEAYFDLGDKFSLNVLHNAKLTYNGLTRLATLYFDGEVVGTYTLSLASGANVGTLVVGGDNRGSAVSNTADRIYNYHLNYKEFQNDYTVSVTGENNKDSINLAAGETTLQLLTGVSDTTGAAVSDASVSYESGNKAVITVSDSGLVTAQMAGTAMVTVTASKMDADLTYHTGTATYTVSVVTDTKDVIYDPILMPGGANGIDTGICFTPANDYYFTADVVFTSLEDRVLFLGTYDSFPQFNFEYFYHNSQPCLRVWCNGNEVYAPINITTADLNTTHHTVAVSWSASTNTATIYFDNGALGQTITYAYLDSPATSTQTFKVGYDNRGASEIHPCESLYSYTLIETPPEDSNEDPKDNFESCHILLSDAYSKTVAVGHELPLNTIIVDNSGAELSDMTVTYASSDTGIATVSDDGSIITGVAVGSADITVTATKTVSNSDGSKTVYEGKSIYTVTVVPPTVVTPPSAVTGLIYTGASQIGIRGGSNYSLSTSSLVASIDANGNAVATDAGTYTATAGLPNSVLYEWTDGTTAAKTIVWTVAQRMLTSSDFTYTLPTDVWYNGSAVTVLVTAKDSNIGSYSVRYYDSDNNLVTSPVDPGTYTVKIYVAGSGNIAEGEVELGSFEIQTTWAAFAVTASTLAWQKTPFYRWNSESENYVLVESQSGGAWVQLPEGVAQVTITASSNHGVTAKLSAVLSNTGFMSEVVLYSNSDCTNAIGTDDTLCFSAGSDTKTIYVKLTAADGLLNKFNAAISNQTEAVITVTAADTYAALSGGTAECKSCTVNVDYLLSTQTSVETVYSVRINVPDMDLTYLDSSAGTGTWNGSAGTVFVENNSNVGITATVSYTPSVCADSLLTTAEKNLKLADTDPYTIGTDYSKSGAVEMSAAIAVPTSAMSNASVGTNTVGTIQVKLKPNSAAYYFTSANQGDLVISGSTPDASTLNSEDGSITLTYNVTAEVTKQIPVPTAVPNLAYDGSEKTGVLSGTGYTLSGTVSATKAGNYTATATLASGYQWEDDTTDAKEISWTIAESYIITIPADQALLPDNALTAYVNASNCGIMAGRTLTVAVASGNGYCLVNGGSSIPYTVTPSKGTALSGDAATVLTVTSAAQASRELVFYTSSAWVAQATLAGEHRDTLTFTVSVS